MARRKTIGANPLDAVIPSVKAEAPAIRKKAEDIPRKGDGTLVLRQVIKLL